MSKQAPNRSLENESEVSSSSASQSNSSSSQDYRTVKPLQKVRLLRNRQYGMVVKGSGTYKTKASSAVLAEIKRLQRSTKFMLPRASFARLVKEISQQHGNYLFQTEAIEAIHEAAELFIVSFISNSYRLTKHRKRETLTADDMQVLMSLVKELIPSLQ